MSQKKESRVRNRAFKKKAASMESNHKPQEKPDRSGHLSWGIGDVEFHPPSRRKAESGKDT